MSGYPVATSIVDSGGYRAPGDGEEVLHYRGRGGRDVKGVNLSESQALKGVRMSRTYRFIRVYRLHSVPSTSQPEKKTQEIEVVLSVRHLKEVRQPTCPHCLY